MTTRYITQDRIKIDVSSMAGPWSQISGQEGEREVVKMRPGAGEEKVLIRSTLEHGDITVSKMFNPDTDVALLRRLNAGDAFSGTAVTETYCDEDGNAIPGASVTHTGCAVKSFAAPEGDANGTDAGMLSVTFTRSGAA